MLTVISRNDTPVRESAQATGKTGYYHMNQTVLITGSSRGIGKAAALRFAEEGNWNIVINCSRSVRELEEVEKELGDFSSCRVLSSIGDVSSEDYVRSLYEKIDASFGGIDVLVNNAGIDYFGLLQDMKSEDWDRVMNVNVKGVFLNTKYAIPLMLKKHSGSIVNISSVWGTHGGSCEAAYSASKGAVIAFSKAMAGELAPSRIRVNALAFGAIDTSMNDRLTSEEKASLSEEIPLGRMGTPKEAAELIYGTAVRHPYLTGQVITMDGGWL